MRETASSVQVRRDSWAGVLVKAGPMNVLLPEKKSSTHSKSQYYSKNKVFVDEFIQTIQSVSVRVQVQLQQQNSLNKSSLEYDKIDKYIDKYELL